MFGTTEKEFKPFKFEELELFFDGIESDYQLFVKHI